MSFLRILCQKFKFAFSNRFSENYLQRKKFMNLEEDKDLNLNFERFEK